MKPTTKPTIDRRIRKLWGNRVKARRKLLGLTQIQLADQSMTSQSLISKVETGDYPNLSLGQMLNIAAALDQEMEELFPWTPGATEARQREMRRVA